MGIVMICGIIAVLHAERAIDKHLRNSNQNSMGLLPPLRKQREELQKLAGDSSTRAAEVHIDSPSKKEPLPSRLDLQECRYEGHCPRYHTCVAYSQSSLGGYCEPYTDGKSIQEGEGIVLDNEQDLPDDDCSQSCYTALRFEENFIFDRHIILEGAKTVWIDEGNDGENKPSYAPSKMCMLQYHRELFSQKNGLHQMKREKYLRGVNQTKQVIRVDPVANNNPNMKTAEEQSWLAICYPSCHNDLASSCPMGFRCSTEGYCVRDEENYWTQTKELQHDLVIVTGANDKYFSGLANLVSSLCFWAPQQKVVVYNLGLTESQVAEIQTQWSNVLEVKWSDGIPASFPSHVFSPKKYAWKPIAMNESLHQYHSIFWLDAGSTVTGPLQPAIDIVRQTGIFLVKGQDNDMKPRAHERTYKYLGYDKTTFVGGPHFSGNTQAYLYPSRYVDTIVKPNAACALQADCIAPNGAGLGTHRYDQTTLSILSYRFDVMPAHHTEYLTCDTRELNPGLHFPNTRFVYTSRQAYQRFLTEGEGEKCGITKDVAQRNPRGTSRRVRQAEKDSDAKLKAELIKDINEGMAKDDDHQTGAKEAMEQASAKSDSKTLFDMIKVDQFNEKAKSLMQRGDQLLETISVVGHSIQPSPYEQSQKLTHSQQPECRYEGHCPTHFTCVADDQSSMGGHCQRYTENIVTEQSPQERAKPKYQMHNDCINPCLAGLQHEENFVHESEVVIEAIDEARFLSDRACTIQYHRSKFDPAKQAQMPRYTYLSQLNKTRSVVRVDPLESKKNDAPQSWIALCYGPCISDADCADGFVCKSPQGVSTKQKQCVRNDSYWMPKEETKNDMVVITGASEAYFVGLQNLISSLCYWAPNNQVVVYNLGMTADQVAEIESSWKNVVEVKWKEGIPSSLPAHVNELKGYAWKPLAINETVYQYKSIFWLDGGSTVTGPLTPAIEIARQTGIFLVKGQDEDMKPMSHPFTYQYFGYEKDTFVGGPHFSGNTQAYIYPSRYIDTIVTPNALCALDEQCISPPTSSLGNHRYDQTTLSILSYRDDIWVPHHTEYLTCNRRELMKDIREPNSRFIYTSRQSYRQYTEKFANQCGIKTEKR